MRDVEVFWDGRAELGECPRWRPKEEALYFVDIAQNQLLRVDGRTLETKIRTFDAPIGCFAFRRRGGFVLAMKDGFFLIDDFDAPLQALGEAVFANRPDIRFNDGRADARGRFFAGSVNMKKSASDAGLYRLAPNGAISRLTDGALTCNGTAFSPDGKVLYHADTPRHVLYAFDFDGATGAISGQKVFHQFVQGDGRPDGGSVDEEGCYWTALYDGGRVARLSPGGEILEEVALPVRRPTMIAFGGQDRRTAYVTTTRQNLTDEALADQPLAGAIFSFRVEVPGLPEDDFAG